MQNYKLLQECACKHYAKKAVSDDVGSPCTEGPMPIRWTSSAEYTQRELETCTVMLIDSTSGKAYT